MPGGKLSIFCNFLISKYRNAQKNSDKQNARIEHDKTLLRVMTAYMKDDTELFKQFVDNDLFKRWMVDTVFSLTYDQSQSAQRRAGRAVEYFYSTH